MGTEGVKIQVGGHRRNSQRFVALVDAADAATVEGYCWSMCEGYAARQVQVGGKHQTVRMHRQILGLGPGDPDVDHISGDKLDNRRDNLRPATNAQNGQNRRHRPYRGVTWDAARNCWRAQAMLDRKGRHLGYFATREEAAAAASAWRRAHMPYSSEDVLGEGPCRARA